MLLYKVDKFMFQYEYQFLYEMALECMNKYNQYANVP